jgi:O-antigen/teichoic acid export membrane protein
MSKSPWNWLEVHTQWEEAILPLQILAVYATFRSVVTLLPQVLTMLGHTRFLMKNGLLTALVMPLSFWVASRWGGAGIAMVWVVVYPLHVLPMYALTFRTLGLRPADYFRAVWPAIRGTALMAAALVLVRLALPVETAPAARLAVMVATGAAVFLGLTVYPQRNRLRSLLATLRPKAVTP